MPIQKGALPPTSVESCEFSLLNIFTRIKAPNLVKVLARLMPKLNLDMRVHSLIKKDFGMDGMGGLQEWILDTFCEGTSRLMESLTLSKIW